MSEMVFAECVFHDFVTSLPYIFPLGVCSSASWQFVTSCSSYESFGRTALVCSSPSLSSGLLENFLMSSSLVIAVGHRSFPPGGADTRPLGWPYQPHFWLGWPQEVMRPVPQGHPASQGWKVAPDLVMVVQLYLGLTLCSGAARCDGHLGDEDHCSLRTWPRSASFSDDRTHVAAASGGQYEY